MAEVKTVPELIRKKRDGEELTADEIKWFIQKVAVKDIEESQIGAMLMAMFLNGMSHQETLDLTTAMVESGDVLKWNSNWVTVDKHSTGGVGDKVSIPLAPALSACGFKVPMMSGRGLAHTGGTLDKLESIPGFNVQLTQEQLKNALENAGCFIAGPTTNLAPADKELYKIRDVTSTVNSTSLIVGSIISKKVAEGVKNLVMDIKVGKAAFFKSEDEATELAKELINVSAGLGVCTKAVLTRMDTPIGRAVGNSLEIIESVQTLRGRGPPDLVELVSTIGGLMLLTTARASTLEVGIRKITDVLSSGRALDCFKKMLIAHGVSYPDADALCKGEYSKVLPEVPASQRTRLKVETSGYIQTIDAMAIAVTCWHLGAGRSTSEEKIDYRVGVKLLKVEGDYVKKDEHWIEVHHKEEKLSCLHADSLQKAISISPTPVEVPDSRILKIIS